jgi:hypothetical protein
MSRQILGVSDAAPTGRGRGVGQLFGGPFTPGSAADLSFIIPMCDIENFSLQFVWGASITCTAVHVFTSNSFEPYQADYQNEARALRPGYWVDTGTRWTTGFTAPSASAAGEGEICSQGKPIDAAYLKVTFSGLAGNGTDTLQGFVSAKSYT